MFVDTKLFKGAIKGRKVEDVAAACGISLDVLEGVGKGVVPPRVATQRRIAQVLGVDRESLFTDEPVKEEKKDD